MLKRAVFLGFSAVLVMAAHPAAADPVWDGCYYRPCYPGYYCYGSYCYPRYYTGYPRYYGYPRYLEYPRRSYVRYGGGYDPYDGSYYRYYSSYRYDDDFDW